MLGIQLVHDVTNWDYVRNSMSGGGGRLLAFFEQKRTLALTLAE